MKIKIIIFIAVITIILGGAREAYAQSLALSITPSLLEVMIKPGKSITQVYKFTNTGDPVVVTVKLYELGTSGVKEDSDFKRDKWISIISNDLDFDKPFLLEAQRTAEFLVKINPPIGASEQDYYRALVFTTTPNPPTDTTMSSFVQNMVSPILITVTSTGVFAKGAQIIKFDIPVILDSFGPLAADLEIKNTGTSYFRPVGKLSLTGLVGRGSFDIIPYAILSGQTKQLVTEHRPPEKESVKSLYLPGFYIGKYQLTLDLTLDEGSTKLSDIKTFYAVPWKAGLVIFVLLIMILWRKRRK